MILGFSQLASTQARGRARLFGLTILEETLGLDALLTVSDYPDAADLGTT